MTFRKLFTIAAFFNLDINQMDVKITFLYDLIDQLIYIEILKRTETEVTKNMVCKLFKALYNLKQSSHIWYEKLLAFLLINLGLIRIPTYHSIFVSDAGIKDPILSVFIDNIKIIAPKGSRIIEKFKQKLSAAFFMVDMEPISFCLGLKVE